MGAKWNNNKFDPNDPRNAMVEPEKVFSNFESLYNNYKEKEVRCAKE